MKAIFKRFVLLLSGLALALDGLVLVDFLLHPLAEDAIFHSTVYRAVVVLVLLPITLLVGFLIIRRVPGNIVGPLLIAWSGTVAYWSIRETIGPVIFALFAYYDFYGWIALFMMLLHFPNGEIHPSTAARWIYRLLGIAVLIFSLIFLSWATFQVPSQLANPFYLPALQPYSDLINRYGVLFLLPILVLALVSPVLRYNKGTPVERQQIKWLALFGGVFVVYVILALIVYPLLTGGQVMNPGSSIYSMIFYIAVGLFPPVAIGVAILRYRLWDIDLIIRRTLIYGGLTVTLAVVYFASVVLLQTLFQRVTGGQSTIAIVLSTLLIAALFSPLRRRIQRDIDQRFYRRKYDVQLTLEAFSASLRDQVELEQLAGQLMAVIQETMQPDNVSLWLKPQGTKKKRTGNDY